MNWLQKNSYIAVLFAAFLFAFAFVLITDDGNTTYEHIEIKHGDSLWSLAEQYRGKMSTHDWIETVKTENDLNSEKIVAGHQLVIPISAEQVNIAQTEEIQSIKIARENK